ncbi:MAG TPA: hypothetical protein DCK98_05640 [Chloroflexi bacterium]|nr:hypothetical protein [Chloroflexota bacterium]HAL27752.1 hypothetical protein [Chloroflexota bacterium]
MRRLVNDLVSFVCVRADHQRATADAGQVQPKDGGLAWCPDKSLDAHEGHQWRTCDASPLAAAATLAARPVTVEFAVS